MNSVFILVLRAAKVTVNFPGIQSGWSGRLDEMEVVEAFSSEPEVGLLSDGIPLFLVLSNGIPC